jgi:class 3 adenylate cyclase
MEAAQQPSNALTERRLTAVVFTDVVGYSALMRIDEASTIQRVSADLERIRGACARHGGEYLNSMGDGLMLAFTSAVAAVGFALDIQQEFANRTNRETGTPLRHRVGIHVGDVFRTSDGQLAGDGVNIAARLESGAPAGGICISQTVHDVVQGKLALDAQYAGERQFKNIDRPLPVWHIQPRAGVVAVPKTAPAIGTEPVLEPFQTSLPAIGRSQIERSEKLVLYGGRPEELVLNFTAIEHAVARHTFDRDVVASMCEMIEACDKRFACYTISSSPGGGLSMALAQLVRDLHVRRDTRVLWIVDDKDATERALTSMSAALADSLYAALLSGGAPASSVVIVLDDVSKASYSAKAKLLAFKQRCEVLAGAGDGPRLALVFGSVGAALALSEDDPIPLELTRADRQRCFDTMTHGNPKVLAAAPDRLDAILSEHPEVRWYENDAHAFIDYLMQHGEPTSQAKVHWLARIDSLSPTELQVVTRTAAAQLIGLHVEERVALQEFGQLIAPGAQDVEQFVRRIQGLAVVRRDWKGLGLSSARRARSILERAGRFSEDFIEQSLSDFLAAAICQIGAHGRRAAETADFARHIFQRLGKKELYQFPNKAFVARRLLQRHANDLRAALVNLPAAAKARWAGTLSRLEWPRGKDQHDPIISTDALPEGDLLCDLCEDALKAIHWGEECARPEILVSLYLAGRRIMRPLGGAPESRGLDVCNYIREIVTDDAFWQAVRVEVMSDDEEAAYRVNELVHARAGFEAVLRCGPRWQVYGRIEGIYARAEGLLASRGLALDAANWLRRSDSFLILIRNIDKAGAEPGEAVRAERAAAIAKQAEYLANAKRCVKENADSQGTWSENVDSAVRRFLRHNPGFAGDLI